MAFRMLLSDDHSSTSSSSSGCLGSDSQSLAGLASAHYDTADAHDDHGDHDDHGEDAFNHIYFIMVFIAALWFAGKLATKLKMPALVGEIVFGIILGPHLLNLPGDEGSHFLIVIGEIGLVMLVVEAGIDVDVGLLKVIGPPALGVAIMGSIFPMSIGFCLSYLCFGLHVQTSIAVGACFAPTSMGIALNVLKKAKILNTPTGQLIIAAAILDDVLALIILSELGAMKEPTAMNILLPLIVSPVLIALFGYLAIRWIPRWIKSGMRFVPKDQQENAILALLFLATFAMVPICHFLGSSHLLGAFLAGLMFCTDHTVHHVWEKQIKRVLSWMLRVFFASTIGFAIPINEFTSMDVIGRGLIYCIAMFGKIMTGFFAKPLSKKEVLTVGFSMSAWGEFAFILATASYGEGTIDKTSFSAVLLAVLLSVIVSPYALSFTLSFFAKRQQERMNEELEKYEGTNVHPIYFAINTKSRGSWGHQHKILDKLFNLQLEIIDFRSWHAPEYNYSHDTPLTKESFYVQDRLLALPPTKHLDDHDKEALRNRVKQIRMGFRHALGERAVISIKRWLPGVSKKDDQLEPTDAYVKTMFGGDIDYQPKNRKSVEYCRREAFKQAHSLMSLFERRATLEDLHRQSSRKLMAEKTKSSGADGDEKFDHSMTFSEDGGKRQRKSYDAGDGDYTGQTGAGGAGALPITAKTINIANGHWDDDEELNQQKQRDDSHMSYIYGDEDAQTHKLPEYSVEQQEFGIEIYNPSLPQLAEDGDDDVAVQDLQHVKANMEMTENTRKLKDGVGGTETDDNDTDAENEYADQQPKNPPGQLKKKLTIKIYPPAMNPVDSRSPVGSEAGSPRPDYIE